MYNWVIAKYGKPNTWTDSQFHRIADDVYTTFFKKAEPEIAQPEKAEDETAEPKNQWLRLYLSLSMDSTLYHLVRNPLPRHRLETLYPDTDVIKIGSSSSELECSSTSELKCSSTLELECSSTSKSELSSYLSSPSKDLLNWYKDVNDQDEEEIDEDDDKIDEQDDEIDKEAGDGKDDFNDELWSPKTIRTTTKKFTSPKIKRASSNSTTSTKKLVKRSEPIRNCIIGLATFIDYAVHNLQKMSNIYPPAAFIDYAVHNLQKMSNIDPPDAEKPLYEGCPDFTKLSAIVKLLNLKEPLVDDLHTLLETGVDTYDASIKDNFNLRAVVLRIINNYPALGTLCGCPYSGFKEKNVAESLVRTLLNISGKIKDGVNARLDLAELEVKPELFAMQEKDKTTLPPTEPLVDDLHTLLETGVDTYDASIKDNFNLRAVVLRIINNYPALGTLCGCPYSGFKEKNVAESLVRTLLNVSGKIKDGVNARLDLAELEVKPELFAMQEKDKTTLPPTEIEQRDALLRRQLRKKQ
nr:hypothetical protein [Tanacetum cinerariifolium]